MSYLDLHALHFFTNSSQEKFASKHLSWIKKNASECNMRLQNGVYGKAFIMWSATSLAY